ncbi:MAG: hypothetical protein GYA51_06810 [Candidatus Methanofastidiosa archaeon]|nr:hypothetical protein [Candidatus Methanofastidiosa archaeon]
MVLKMEKLQIPTNLKGTELAKYLNEKLDESTDSLCQDTEHLLKFAKKWNCEFYNYKINNSLLAYIQRPDFTFLAGKKLWQELGRQVIDGERPIKILKPIRKKIKGNNGKEKYIMERFFPISVFDISQTEGEEIDIGNCSNPMIGCVQL